MAAYGQTGRWRLARRFVSVYYNRLVAVLVVILVILMIAAVREFINYATIEESTNAIVQEQVYWSDKIAFEEHFLLPYLDSPTARYFFQHENGVLYDNEYLLVFDDDQPLVGYGSGEEMTSEDVRQADRKASWRQFFERLWEEATNN